MADKFKGRLIVGKLEPADDALEIASAVLAAPKLQGATDVQGSLSPSGAGGGDVLSGSNIVRRINVGRAVTEGDADHTLAVAADTTSDIDGTLLLYNTALTALRTITLTVAGAYAGMTWRVVRQAAATGAFDLDVGGLKTLAAASQWCEVVFDGTAWVLAANGTL